MFLNAMGLILADHNRIQLSDLSRPRALAAIPFAGRYRIIDFMLSNMVNSGITSVGVIAMHKYKSLMDHLGTGSSWDLDRKNKGLSLLPPFIYSDNDGGEADSLSGLLDFIRMHRRRYVIIANSNVVFNATFHDLVKQHQANEADISVLYNRDGMAYGAPSAILSTDRKGWVKDVLFNPPKPPSRKNTIGVMVIERERLMDLVHEDVARGNYDFSIDSLIRRHDELKILAVEYKGVLLRINSIETYFSSTMALFDEAIRQDLFWSGLPVYTKIKDEAPARYGLENQVENSLISDGCLIQGTVINSLLFRGVTVAKHAVVENSIVMQDSYVSEGVTLEQVILDKNCFIRPGIKLVGQKEFPVVIGKGAVV